MCGNDFPHPVEILKRKQCFSNRKKRDRQNRKMSAGGVGKKCPGGKKGKSVGSVRSSEKPGKYSVSEGNSGEKKKCSGGDLNPHALRHTPLKRTCLPFHHPSNWLETKKLAAPEILARLNFQLADFPESPHFGQFQPKRILYGIRSDSNRR